MVNGEGSSRNLVDAANQTDDMEKRNDVRFLLLILISRTVTKAQIYLPTLDQNATVDHLLSKIWDQVKFADFEVSSETIQHFDQVVLMELVKKLGNELLVLKCMMSENPVNEELIVQHFVQNLLRPKSRSFMNRIKSFVKTHWPWMLATAGVVSATLWIRNTDTSQYVDNYVECYLIQVLQPYM